MEVKSNFQSPFVRHGFGRVSATSKISFDQESDIYTSLEEMGQSEVEENHSKTTVKHCISKFNSNSTPTEGKNAFKVAMRAKICNLEKPRLVRCLKST